MSLIPIFLRTRVARLIICLLIFTLALLYVQLVLVTGPRLAGEILKEQIAKQTHDLYSIEFQKIHLSPFSQKLDVHDFKLIPTKNIPDSIRRVYEIDIPRLEIEVASIARIYLKRELVLSSISVINPTIKLTRLDPERKKSTLSIETGDLYKVINKYLFKFSIGQMNIEDASFLYTDQQKEDSLRLYLDDIDFSIENFLIDSVHHSDQLLHTENINLIITDESFNLSDSIHQLSFDLFSISTKTQNILFNNLKIKERPDHPAKDGNRYDIELPELNFRGIDFTNAYLENKLHLDSVRLLNPKVSIRQMRNQKKRDKKSDVPLMLAQLFDQITVGQFYLDHAAVSYAIMTDSVHAYQMKVSDLSLSITNFNLDSLNLRFDRRFSYFETAELTGEKLQLTWPDSAHQMDLGRVHLSTKDSTFSLENLQVKQLKKGLRNYGQGIIPLIELRGFDFARAWFFKDARARMLSIKGAEAELHFLNESPVREFPYLFRTLEIDKIQLTQADLNLIYQAEHLQTSKLNFELKNLSIGIDSSDEWEIQDTLKINLIQAENSSYTRNGSGPSVTRIEATDDLKTIKLDGFLYEEPDHVPVNITNLRLYGFDFNQFRYKQRLQFDSLKIVQPTIELADNEETANVPSPYWLQHIQFKKIVVEDGYLNAQSNENNSYFNGFSLILSGFSYDSVSNEYATNLYFQADTFQIALNRFHHTLSGNQLMMNQSDSTLHLAHLVMEPDATDSLPIVLYLKTGALELEALNLHDLLNKGNIQFSNGTLQTPYINLTLSETGEDPHPLPPTIQFDQLQIKHAGIAVKSKQTGTVFTTEKLDGRVTGFNLQDTSALFFAENYELTAMCATMASAEFSDTIRVEQIEASTQTGNFNITDLKVAHPNKADVFIPEIFFRGFDVQQMLLDHTVSMDSMIIHKPSVSLAWQQVGGTDLHTPALHIRHVAIDEANLDLYYPNLPQQDSIALSNMALIIKELAYEPNQKATTQIARSLVFSGEDFHYRLDDSLYIFHVGRYTYTHPKMELTLEDVALQPTYNRGEFQTKIDYQQDWLDITLDKLQLSGFQLDSLINNRKLLASRLLLVHLLLDTHRDKRLPRKAGEYQSLPQTWLKLLPFGLNLDTVTIAQSKITHSEFSEEGEYPGTLFFNDLDIQLLNVSNLTSSDTSGQWMKMHGSGTLMKSGNFILDVNFDLNSPQDRFTMEGTVGNMDLTEMNAFLENTAFVQVKGGINKLLKFNVDANEDYAIGKMVFFYDNLKITILNEKNTESKGLGNTIKSLFANTFVVNTRNPHFIFVREGNIFYERDKSKSVFNYWAKSILSGVVSSIGATNNKKEIKKQNDQIRSKYEELNVE